MTEGSCSRTHYHSRDLELVPAHRSSNSQSRIPEEMSTRDIRTVFWHFSIKPKGILTEWRVKAIHFLPTGLLSFDAQPCYSDTQPRQYHRLWPSTSRTARGWQQPLSRHLSSYPRFVAHSLQPWLALEHPEMETNGALPA